MKYQENLWAARISEGKRYSKCKRFVLNAKAKRIRKLKRLLDKANGCKGEIMRS